MAFRTLQPNTQSATSPATTSGFRPLTAALPTKPVTESSGAMFPSSSTDNPFVAGAKALGNLPQSAYNTAKGVFEAIRHPVDTIKGTGEILFGAGEAGARKLVGDTTTPTLGAEQKFKEFTQILNNRYGTSFGDKKFTWNEFLGTLQKTATEDPFGFGTDVLSLAEGGAGLAGKTAELNKAVGLVGKTATSPVTKAASKVANTVSGSTKFGISQVTGLNPEVVTEILKNPQSLKNINPELRVETATKVGEALDQRLGELSDMGKGYETIRQAEGVVTIPPNTIKDVLNKYGVKLDEGNKIVTSPESRPLSAGDRAAIQDFIDNYGSVTTHTNNSFLNTREALSNLAKYDTTKTNISTNIARDLRAEYDKFGKAQVKGLKDLDTAYAPERELLGQLKKDIFDAKGDLKDSAISRIANVTGKGKEQLLERVKQIVPDIEERVNLIKVAEDIERANGLKVGTYARAGVGLLGLTTGNIPAIIGAIIAQPSIAVPLLRGAGYVGQKAAPIINTLKAIGNDINNFRIPAPMINKETGGLNMGASIQSVTPELVAKRVDGEDLRLIRDFVQKKDLNSYLKAQPIIEGAGLYGMNGDTLQRFLKEVLDLNTKRVPVKAN